MRDPVRPEAFPIEYLLNPREAVCFKRVHAAYQQDEAGGSGFGIEGPSGFLVGLAPVPRHVG